MWKNVCLIGLVVQLSCGETPPGKALSRHVWNSTGPEPVFDKLGVPHFQRKYADDVPVSIDAWFMCFNNYTDKKKELFDVIFVGQTPFVCATVHENDTYQRLGTLAPGETKTIVVKP